jgi:hypothetical protein
LKLFLNIAHWYVPAFLKKKELSKLFNITAEAFGCAAPSISDLSFEESLEQYAQFTRTLAEKIHSGSSHLQRIQNQLYHNAYELGDTYRELFHVSTLTEAMDVCKILYRILGIDFRSTVNGKIEIPSCYFSTYYSASTCRLISFLDAGLMAGLSGGGRLTFFKRITEGFHCCRAEILLEEQSR